MTEPDEALLWARERAKRRFSSPTAASRDICAYIDAGKYDGELSDEAQAYRAGAAASEARIKALEDEVRELKEALTATVMQATARQIPITNEIKFSAPIRAEMKEGDQ